MLVSWMSSWSARRLRPWPANAINAGACRGIVPSTGRTGPGGILEGTFSFAVTLAVTGYRRSFALLQPRAPDYRCGNRRPESGDEDHRIRGQVARLRQFPRLPGHDSKVVKVSCNATELNLTTSPRSFDIANTPKLEVQIEDFGDAEHQDNCSDVIMMNSPKPVVFKATTGRATIVISQKRSKKDYSYRVTVVLEDVALAGPNGEAYHIARVEMKDVLVSDLGG